MDRSYEYINKSLTDTCMWKLGLRPRNSQKRKNINGIFDAVRGIHGAVGIEVRQEYRKLTGGGGGRRQIRRRQKAWVFQNVFLYGVGSPECFTKK